MSVLLSLLPKAFLKSLEIRRPILCFAELKSELEAQGIGEAAPTAMRLLGYWFKHPATHPAYCTSLECFEERLRHQQSKPRSMTPEQATILPDWCEQWLRIGNETAPADRRRAENAITELYQGIGVDRPKFLWVESPASAIQALVLQQVIAENPAAWSVHRTNRGRGTWREIHDRLCAQLENHMGRYRVGRFKDQIGVSIFLPGLEAQLETQLGTHVALRAGEFLGERFANPDPQPVQPVPDDSVLGGQHAPPSMDNQRIWIWEPRPQRIELTLAEFLSQEIMEPLRSQLHALGGQLRARLGDPMGDGVPGRIEYEIGPPNPAMPWLRQNAPRGAHEVHWIAIHTFARDVLGVWYPTVWSRRLDLWADVARSCNRWWPYERLCVISERPSAVHRDQAGTLHGASGPAVQFRDGYGLYMWHGTSVPSSWINEPDRLDPSYALTWHNVEQRRAAAGIIGWKRVIERLAPRTIDKADDPQIGELLEVNLPHSGAVRFLKVRCGTGREFVLSVPRTMRTALQANAWTYDIGPDQYPLEART